MGEISPELVWSYVIQVIFWGNILLGTVLVFAEHRNPSSTWAWLLVLYFIPVLGFLLYLFFGQDLRKRHLFKAKQQEDQTAIARYQAENIDEGKTVSNRVKKRYYDMIRMLLQSASAVVTDRNEVDLFSDGTDKFEALITDLKAADSYIWMQYYIFHNDELGKRIMDVLVEKAKQGVDVASSPTAWAHAVSQDASSAGSRRRAAMLSCSINCCCRGSLSASTSAITAKTS